MCCGVPYQLRRNWFKPSEASAKRRVIQKLILELSQGRSLESLREYTEMKGNSPDGEISADEQLTRPSLMSLRSDKQGASQSADELGPVRSNPSQQAGELLIESCSYPRFEARELHVDLCESINPGRQDEHAKLRSVHVSIEDTEWDDVQRDMHPIGSDEPNASCKSGAGQSSAHTSVVNDYLNDSVVLPDVETLTHERCLDPRLSLQVISLYIYIFALFVVC